MGSVPVPDHRGLAILALGLAGETGEVAEVVEGGNLSDPERQLALCKELGDVLYYWARLAMALQLNVDQLQTEAVRLTRSRYERPASDTSQAMLALTAKVGKVVEGLKKHLRDGSYDKGTMQLAMQEVLQCWAATCWVCGCEPLDVLRCNETKLNSRLARNTLKGSGNDR